MSNPKLHYNLFAGCPLILTFANVAASSGCKCENRTTSFQDCVKLQKQPLPASKKGRWIKGKVGVGVSDFAPRFGLALLVVAIAIAAIMISRRNYAKAAIVERTIDAFRLEFQHAIDAA